MKCLALVLALVGCPQMVLERTDTEPRLLDIEQKTEADVKLDSEKQRRVLLNLLHKVPIQTNLGELLNGLDPEILEVIRAIKEAEIEEKH